VQQINVTFTSKHATKQQKQECSVLLKRRRLLLLAVRSRK